MNSFRSLRSVVLFVSLILFFPVICFAEADLIPVSVSDDGDLVLLTGSGYDGLILKDIQSGKIHRITDARNAGYYAAISPGKRFVSYKTFAESGEGLLHVPMVYSIEGEAEIEMFKPSSSAGVPVFSENGICAFTSEDQLYILDKNLNSIFSFDLGHNVQMIEISPDGSKIAYSDENERMMLLDMQTGKRRSLSSGRSAYWNPRFSPDGKRILFQSVGGSVVLCDLLTGATRFFDKGYNPGWVDSQTFCFTEKIIQKKEVVRTEAIICGTDQKMQRREKIYNGDAHAIVNNGWLVFSEGENLKRSRLTENKTFPTEVIPLAGDFPGIDAVKSKSPSSKIAAVTEITGVPYLHQVYDTPNDFNGHWACGASSALMAIQYFDILPDHPITCSWPSSHTHNFGWYVANIYSYNGYTYDIRGADASGDIAYGGYGFIIQNSWEDTKGHMAEYFRQHGLESSVDWSATFSEAQDEIDNGDPFVLLNSLTSSGHYITCIGYVENQHTLVFNDPYGNKNTAGYPSYDGTRVFYDWPGYNNGYENLNTVHCYIYARGDVGPRPWDGDFTADDLPAFLEKGEQRSVTVTYENTGMESWSEMTRLATSDPRGRHSDFEAGSWNNFDRPSELDQDSVKQGDTGSFSFDISAPDNAGHFSEGFELVQDGVSWFEGSKDDFGWFVTVGEPGIIHIEAEDYDRGGEGNGFHDLTTANEGGEYRSDPVDIEVCTEGGYNVGWVEEGEWLKYSNISGKNTQYDVTMNLAANYSSSFHIEINGTNVTGSLDVDPTGGWQTWETRNPGTVTLTQGMNEIKIVAESDGWNIDWIEFREVEPTPTPMPTPTPTETPLPDPNSLIRYLLNRGGNSCEMNDDGKIDAADLILLLKNTK